MRQSLLIWMSLLLATALTSPVPQAQTSPIGEGIPSLPEDDKLKPMAVPIVRPATYISRGALAPESTPSNLIPPFLTPTCTGNCVYEQRSICGPDVSSENGQFQVKRSMPPPGTHHISGIRTGRPRVNGRIADLCRAQCRDELSEIIYLDQSTASRASLQTTSSPGRASISRLRGLLRGSSRARTW